MWTTLQIDQVFKENEYYLGTFPMNRLPDLPKSFPKSIIINTDPANKVGDHWIALVLTHQRAFYFDSFSFTQMLALLLHLPCLLCTLREDFVSKQMLASLRL